MSNFVVNESTVILALETSCDETAASVVMGGNDVLSSIVSSQIEIHARFGGVVPEVASRAHMEALKQEFSLHASTQSLQL
jgi:N6-L-threonylcarbamoyladenine synthase